MTNRASTAFENEQLQLHLVSTSVSREWSPKERSLSPCVGGGEAGGGWVAGFGSSRDLVRPFSKTR